MCLGFWFDSSAWRRYSSVSFFSFGGGFLVLGFYLYVCRFKQLWCDCISRRRVLLRSRVMCEGGKRFFVVFSFYLRVLREFLTLPSVWLILLQDLSFSPSFLFGSWISDLSFTLVDSFRGRFSRVDAQREWWQRLGCRKRHCLSEMWELLSPQRLGRTAQWFPTGSSFCSSGSWQRLHQKLLSNAARNWRWSPPVPFLVRPRRIEFSARTLASQVLLTLLYKYFCKLFDLFSWCIELSRYQRFYRIYAKTDVGLFPKMSRTLLAHWRRRN